MSFHVAAEVMEHRAPSRESRPQPQAAPPERNFLLPWLCSAAAVTVIRLLHAADLGYDLTLQIQAGLNVLAGNGLTIYWPMSDGLADPLTLITLTQYPAGYSLVAAAFMGLGASPGAVVKVLGATATMAGWWGWARLAFPYMAHGAQGARFGAWAAYGIAIVSPLLFTSSWGGTDIFLWAGVPWVVHYLTRASEARAQAPLRTDVVAGALIGLLVLTRYASLFLAAYAVVVIAAQCRLRVGLTIRRLMATACGIVPALALQIWINHFVSSTPATPGGLVVTDERLANMSARVWHTLSSLGGASHGVLFWTPGRWQPLWTDLEYAPLALAAAGALLVLPVVLLGVQRRQQLAAGGHDPRIVAAGLLLVLPLFLWLCEVVGQYAFVRDPRYYWPVRPLAVYIAYVLATAPRPGRQSAPLTLLRYAGRAYLMAFLATALANACLMFVPGARGDARRQLLVGNGQLRPWPSLSVDYEFSMARRFVLDIMSSQPETMLITSYENWFYAAPDADHSRIQRMEVCSALRATHIDGPARVLLLVSDTGGAAEELPFSEFRERTQRPECLERLPAITLVRRFPDEQLKVLESTIREGTRVQLKPDTR
jgi:hypothetical protein